MTRAIAATLALTALTALVVAQTARRPIRFAAYDLLIDPGAHTLGAYQVRIESASGTIKLVGVEGGERASAFADPPAYDPRALHANANGDGGMGGDRIILAAYTLNAAPASSQPVRVARIHVQITGGAPKAGSEEPQWSLTLDAAADADGKPITPAVSLSPTGDTP